MTGVRIVWSASRCRRRGWFLHGRRRRRRDVTGVGIRGRSLWLGLFFFCGLFDLRPVSGMRISGRSDLVAAMAG